MNGRSREELVQAGRRIEALADRIAALRERLRPPAPGPAAPLFAPSSEGSGADDVEAKRSSDESRHEVP